MSGLLTNKTNIAYIIRSNGWLQRDKVHFLSVGRWVAQSWCRTRWRARSSQLTHIDSCEKERWEWIDTTPIWCVTCCRMHAPTSYNVFRLKWHLILYSTRDLSVISQLGEPSSRDYGEKHQRTTNPGRLQHIGHTIHWYTTNRNWTSYGGGNVCSSHADSSV